ncbi:MAG: CDP-alcohol phosphatidyltransferase family protein [Dehalococcoidia bacterium]|nr:CDP-alcohol phosphatidyltransferase family protein [Dehalococcoidia bacterium]
MPITPNEVSIVALALALAAAALIAADAPIAGGVLVQVSSVVDGVDGDLARAKSMTSRFGALFDSVLDRYADVAIAAGMAWHAYRQDSLPQPLLVGMAAAVGMLMVSYSRARLEAAGGRDAAAALLGLASRDVRLLLLAIGAAVGEAYWALVVVAGMSYVTLCWRMWGFWRPSASAWGVHPRNRA